MLSEVVEIVCLVMTSLIEHVIAYVVNPHTILLHAVMACLIYALHVDGEVKGRQLVTMAITEALMVYVLWLAVSHGLRSVFAIWICLNVYDGIVRPAIRVQEESPYLVADLSVEETLSQLNVQFESTIDELDPSHGTRRLNCIGLQIFAFERFGYWIQQLHLSDCSFKMEDITDVTDSCDEIIAKRFRSLGIKSDRCLYLTMNLPNGGRTSMCIVLVADTMARRDDWLNALGQLLAQRINDARYTWLLKLCAEATAETSPLVPTAANPPFATGVVKETTLKVGGNVDFELAMRILNLAGRQAEKIYAKAQFKKFASVSGFLMRKLSLSGPDLKQHILTWEQFLAFFSCAVTRQEISDVYDNLLGDTSKSKTLTLGRFYDFVTGTQKERISLSEVEQWIYNCEPVLRYSNLTSLGFVNYILAEEHSIFKRECNTVYQDMNQPLSHYFIATSHNTYLTKDQLTSKSSVDMYISAFKRGCKSVELDVWDGANGEPIICHGYTLTSKILAKDVITAVKNYAFCLSMYPVILSFENHLCVEQQKVLAKYLVEILGDMLYTKPIPANEKCLPSPEALKGHILIKTKKLKPGSDESAEDFYEDDLFNMNTDELVDDVIAQQHQEMKEKQQSDGDDVSIGSTVSIDCDGMMDDVISMKSEADEDESNEASEERKTKAFDVLVDALENVRKQNKEKIKPPRIAQEFSDLVVYCQGTSIRDFEQFKQNGKHYEMISFGEKRAAKQSRDDPLYCIQYTQRQLCRVYPGGGRIDSSNLDPVNMWNIGCQLVALNYQTPGPEMQLNQALFQSNGLCGYVLKPEFLRQENTKFDPRTPGENYDILAVQVISAYQVPYKNEKSLKSERSHSVQVKIVGVEADAQCSRTKTVKSNGLNPLWNEMFFFKVHVPQLAFVIFNVLVKNVCIAQYTIPYRCLQQGYRRVPLLNKSSEPFSYSYLFTHINIQSPQTTSSNSNK